MKWPRHGARSSRPVRIWPVDPLPATRTGDTQGWVSHMDTGQAVDLVRHSLIMALTVSAPMLLIGLVVGIAISLLQAVTQIQEQTLSFIPKIVAMVAAAIMLAPWTAQRLMDYSREMFTSGIMN